MKVLFFGVLKDIVGRAAEDLEAPNGWLLRDVFDHYAEQSARLSELKDSIVLAKNQQFCGHETALRDGDEVAFLPPVSGGCGPHIQELEDAEGGHFFALTREPIDVRVLTARVLRGEDGAVVTFEGVVRNNTDGRATLYLEYECYESMAIEMMARIGREIAGAHVIGRIAIVHRLGRLEIGETSVAVVVAAPHRKPAFEAALEGIDRLKRLVPIWKKEYFADGEAWVEGQWDESVRRR